MLAKSHLSTALQPLRSFWIPDSTLRYPADVVPVEIMVIGDEILLGLVQDTNSSYLCRVLRAFDARATRVTAVGDEPPLITGEIRAALDRRTEVVFTCGGLGPTDDDLTLEAVAVAAGRPLELNPDASEFVARRYRELTAAGRVDSSAMTPAREKMARVPSGSIIIENPVGAAPATLLEVEGAWIVSLPGVPAELRAIVEGPLESALRQILGPGAYREAELIAECNDESVLAPLLQRVKASQPGVYIKSRAAGFGPEVRFRITAAASAGSGDEAETLLREAVHELKHVLRGSGIELSGG